MFLQMVLVIPSIFKKTDTDNSALVKRKAHLNNGMLPYPHIYYGILLGYEKPGCFRLHLNTVGKNLDIYGHFHYKERKWNLILHSHVPEKNINWYIQLLSKLEGALEIAIEDAVYLFLRGKSTNSIIVILYMLVLHNFAFIYIKIICMDRILGNTHARYKAIERGYVVIVIFIPVSYVTSNFCVGSTIFFLLCFTIST